MNCPYCLSLVADDLDCKDCHVMFTDISRLRCEGHYHTIDGIDYMLIIDEDRSILRLDDSCVKYLKFNYRVNITPKTAVDVIKKLLKLQVFI